MTLWIPGNDIARAALRAALLLAATACIESQGAWGDALDGTLEVRSAYVDVDHDVVQLHAHVQYPVNEQIRGALQDGITLSFDLDVNVVRERRMWFDAEVASLQLRRELAYYTVSDRYVVRDVRSGEQASFPTLELALDYLGTVDGWPIVVAPQLNPHGNYRVSIRAGIRRGRMPDALRTVMFWTNDWHRTSRWYSWSLAQ